MSKNTEINRETIQQWLDQPVQVQIALASDYLEICRTAFNTIMNKEVDTYSGETYTHDKPKNGQYSRWGYNQGSIRVAGQKIPIEVPRVRDTLNRKDKKLATYSALKQIPEQNSSVYGKIMHGVSTRDFPRATDLLFDSFGFSSTSVCRQFKEATQKALEEFEKRKFEQEVYVALLLDGKALAGEQMIVCMGITQEGNKRALSVVQSSTENSRAIGQMLEDLKERGLKWKQGLLFVTDGSKGIHKAIKDAFRDKGILQRCQWHKRENVVSCLNEMDQTFYRKKLQRAYQEESYTEAKRKLLEIEKELSIKNRKAAQSLLEGLEETLTLKKLGVSEWFQTSLATTNCIESLNSGISKYTIRVKRWMNSDQRYRWCVCAILEMEKRMKKIRNYKKINRLQEAISKAIMIKSRTFDYSSSIIR